MTYLEFENLWGSRKSEICLFGAGRIGRTWGYDLVTASGAKVNFFCDNKITSGTKIRDGVEVCDMQYLYRNKEKVQVFLTVSQQYQKNIISQLKEHGISDVIIVDYNLLIEILDSIDVSGKEEVKHRYYAIYNDIEYLKKRFMWRTGYRLNIDNPVTFNEKLQWLKIYDRNPQYTQMVDKYEAKKYAAGKIGIEYIIPTLGVWGSFGEIAFDKLPDQFVLKCTHDSGSVAIIDRKNGFDIEQTKKEFDAALKTNYFWIEREWPYKNVPRKIIAEKYLGSLSKEEIKDYKFLCFNGRVKMIFTCTERHAKEGLKVTFFDSEWRRMPFERHYPSSKKEIVKPENLKLMIDLAERMSEGIPFVRVDFYEIENKVYFGEMTFFPGGGMEEFEPWEWDKILGDWIVLPKGLKHDNRDKQEVSDA